MSRDAVDESDENETSAPTHGTMTPIISTSTLRTTTTTTAMSTSRPVITTTQHNYDRKDSRFYDGASNSPTHSINNSQTTQNSPVMTSIKNPNVQFNNNGKSAEIREALQHAIKVSREGNCQWPRARLIPVRDVYPSPSTTYIPHCAILHRCSDDTGCCRSEALTCVPKQSHKVELYFYNYH
ncbi:hypothetical protein PV327_008991 [Microctonus hyperodae]|uniref:Platelet-derived growth factor (PDGF) family profile domain-containing protein n=1 Tax=Microctonus hyperodae TaxID=165561 RepID=A0AA39KVF3_MICHY|nr:hypothetical protein PV327_008991 [Microctonus hyperodae]